MLEIALFQPEIPANTGNILRLAANTGCRVHLIAPLGFVLDDRRMRRAGLDYRDLAELEIHDHWQAFADALAGRRWLAFSTRGQTCYSNWSFRAGDVLLFGPESRGLPESVLDGIAPERRLFIPQRPDSRSLNLANAVAVGVYEAWRQCSFQ